MTKACRKTEYPVPARIKGKEYPDRREKRKIKGYPDASHGKSYHKNRRRR